MAERWLVLSHVATNSGAPRMLLEVLRAMRAERSGWSCEIVLGAGGVLTDQFRQLGPVTIMADPRSEGTGLQAGLYRKFIDRPLLRPRRAAAWMQSRRAQGFHLVYNNTTMNGALVAVAEQLGCPVLTHVHELTYAMHRFTTRESLRQTLDHTDHFLAVSEAVKADLAGEGIASDRITVTPNFLHSLPDEPSDRMRRRAREALKLPFDGKVIVGCGHIDWLKGTDVFIEVAANLAGRMKGEIAFLWLGGESDRAFARRLRQLVKARRLEGIVRFVGEVADATPWYTASDVVAVTSRHESFSLVALEAGSIARPVVAFAGARGPNDLLGKSPNLLGPMIDPALMADALAKFLDLPIEAAAEGRRLRARIAEEYLAKQRVPAIAAVANHLIRKAGRD